MVRDKVGYFLQKTRVTLSKPDPCTKEIHLNVVFPTKDSIYHLFTDLVFSHGTAGRRIRYWRLLATSGDPPALKTRNLETRNLRITQFVFSRDSYG